MSERTGSLVLADETRQFALLLESVTDYAIYMLDAEGYICTWNAGGERIKGYKPREVIGEHFSRFYTPEDVAERLPEHGLAMARAHGKFEAEGWRVRKDGSRFYASVVIDPIWQSGELIGYAKITRDITERYQAQQALQATQKALAESQKMEAIGKLTLGLAHDFNNLLTIVMNSLDLIAMRAPDQRTADLVETALRAADRGALLTRQLLSFGRGQRLSPERRDVNALIERSMELYRRACGTGVNFRYEAAAGLPMVEVDVSQFEAALLNLISNSRDAMPQGGQVVLSTALHRGVRAPGTDELERDYVCVTVEDDGMGIPPEVQQRVFEPFFTTKEVGKGSGLGLSQVFGFTMQSGGFVQLSSLPGRGTTVCLCLPPSGEPR